MPFSTDCSKGDTLATTLVGEAFVLTSNVLRKGMA